MSTLVLAPLRIVAYRRLLAAVFVSNVALFAHDVAAVWLIYQMTGSALWVGAISVGVVLPQLLLGLPAGVLADRFSRTGLLRLTLICRAGVAFVLAAVHISGGTGPLVLVVASVLLGTGLAVSLPAFSAMIPDIVPRQAVGDAVSLQSAVMNVARAVGPALGGVLAGLGRFEVAFALNGLSYLVVVVALRGLRPATIASTGERFRGALTSGLSYVRRTSELRTVIAVTGLFAVVAATLQVLLPTLAATRYGMSGTGYGVLSACFGGGAVLGAVTLKSARILLRGRVVPVAMLIAAGSGLVLGTAQRPAVAAVALALSALAWVWAWTTLTTITQLWPENHLRARTLSVLHTVTTGLFALGAATSGGLADSVGAGTAMVVVACGAAVASAVVWFVRLPDVAALSVEVPA